MLAGRRLSPIARSLSSNLRTVRAPTLGSHLKLALVVHTVFQRSSFHTSSPSNLAIPLSNMTSPAQTYPTPPTKPPTWSLTPSQIDEAVATCISTSKALLDKVAALPTAERTFETVVRPLALGEGEADSQVEPALFLQYVSTDEAVRNKSIEGDKALQEYSLTALTRMDVYQALLDAQKHTETNGIKLNPEEDRLLKRMILDRTRNGLALTPEKREELLEVKKKIMSLAVDFQTACNQEKGFLLFTLEELDGVPQDIISGYPEEDGKRKVTFKTPDIFPVFKFANLPATRKAAVLGYEGKTLSNVPILEELVSLRKQVATILGYKNYAEYILEIKMAKTPETVFAFLNDLEEKLRPVGEAERVEFLKLKKEVHEKKGLEFDGKLYLWDYRYYDRLWMEKNLRLDEEKVKEYFPVSTVVPAMLDIYRTLLNVEFFPVPRTEEAGGLTWHEEAEMYAVWDAGKNGQRGDFLGYMHLDLFPRENKYGHAAVWGLIPGWLKEDGTRNYPVVSMVANLAKPTPTRPALMKHQDAVTFLHEMGHAFHGLCSKTQFARFHGTHVARDFVEAPSQMLENWCWTPAQLKDISNHYERKGESLPQDLIESVVKSKKAGQGLFNLRQLFHAQYDMILHTSPEEIDQTKLWVDLREKISLVTTGGEYVGGQSGFAHIAGGYEAGYYGYLYSQAFSADMFATVFEANPMDPAKGMEYRQKILQPGGSREELDSLVDFLGRAPSNVAFLESILPSDSPAKL
ncbi:metallopeptidase MepB [Meredithblackwellia eburnea MCA 4105]